MIRDEILIRLQNEASDLLSCAEWHETQAWEYRTDYEYLGGNDNNSPVADDLMLLIDQHCKWANAIRDILKSR